MEGRRPELSGVEVWEGGRIVCGVRGLVRQAYHVHAFITDTIGLTILAVSCVLPFVLSSRSSWLEYDTLTSGRRTSCCVSLVRR